MKRILFFIFCLSFYQSNAQTSCDTVTNRILMIGDSWSNFPVGFGSFPKNLDRFGYTNIGMFSNTTDLSINGAVTADFLSPAGKAAVQSAIISNPTIEVVNLSIGGNDMLDTWNNSMDSLTTDSLLDATMGRVDSIIDYLLALKPTLKIFIPGYDFANFGEVIQTYSLPALHFFYSRWNGMGQPDFVEMNKLLTRASDKFSELANTNSQVTYNNALGLMQYLHGQTSPLGISPGGTYPPFSVPFPGGRMDYPTPKVRMNDYILFQDCFHLSSEGFDEFYTYHFESYYWNYLRGKVDFSTPSEGNQKDGGISSNSIISGGNIALGNNLTIGNSKGILSFNTSGISGTSLIHRADLFFHRDNQTGTLPSFSKVVLEVKDGFFGSGPTLDFGDYSSTSSRKDTACVYGTVSDNGYWMRIRVPASLLPHISSSGTTQFRISMLDSTNGSMLYFSTGDSLKKPFLDVEYLNPTLLLVNENSFDPMLYPNPTSGDELTIGNVVDFRGEVIAIDLSGRTLPLSVQSSRIDVSQLMRGAYFLVISEGNKTATIKFVKL